MQRKLTKRTVDSLDAPATGRLYVYDTELPGFGLSVTPSGVKTFFAQYRTAGGRRGVVRRLALGRFGALTVEEGRAEAKKTLALAAQGHDPAVSRRGHKTALRVEELAPDYLKHVRAKLKPRTLDLYERSMRNHVLPALGRKRVADVTTADVSKMHLDMVDTPGAANRVLQLVSAFLSWAVAHGHRPEGVNPVSRVERYPEQGRERFLSPAEIARLGAVLVEAETTGIPAAPQRKRKPKEGPTAKHRPKSAGTPHVANRYHVAVIRFLLLTGWRKSEARELRWDEVDLARGIVMLGDTKAGRQARALGAPAVELLEALPRLEDSPWVFPGTKDGRPVANIERLWDAVRLAAGLKGVRIHDLRHSFASTGLAGGLSLPLIGALLGHLNPRTTQRYAHLADDPRRVAADKVANEIAASMTKPPAAAAIHAGAQSSDGPTNVVPIRREA